MPRQTWQSVSPRLREIAPPSVPAKIALHSQIAMVKQTAPLELLVDTHKYNYGFDAAALVKIDAEDPAAGAFYGLRAVGWPSGMAVQTPLGPSGHTFMTVEAALDYCAIELPAIVQLEQADAPDMLAIAFRIYGAPGTLSVVCVRADLRIDDKNWVTPADYSYIMMTQIDRFKSIQANDGSHFIKNLGEFIKNKCPIFTGLNMKSLKDARNWCNSGRWIYNSAQVVTAAELLLRRAIAANTGSKAAVGSKSKGAAISKETQSAAVAVDKQIKALDLLKRGLRSFEPYYNLPLEDRVIRVTPSQMNAMPFPQPPEDQVKLLGAVGQGILRAQCRPIWGGLLVGKGPKPPHVSPTLRGQFAKVDVASPPKQMLLPKSHVEEAQSVELAPAAAIETSPTRIAIPIGSVVQLDDEAEFGSFGADEVEEGGEPRLDKPVPQSADLNLRKRKEAEPVKEPPPSKAMTTTKKSVSPKPKPGKKQKNVAPTGGKPRREYNKSPQWYMRYNLPIPKEMMGTMTAAELQMLKGRFANHLQTVVHACVLTCVCAVLIGPMPEQNGSVDQTKNEKQIEQLREQVKKLQDDCEDLRSKNLQLELKISQTAMDSTKSQLTDAAKHAKEVTDSYNDGFNKAEAVYKEFIKSLTSK